MSVFGVFFFNFRKKHRDCRLLWPKAFNFCHYNTQWSRKSWVLLNSDSGKTASISYLFNLLNSINMTAPLKHYDSNIMTTEDNKLKKNETISVKIQNINRWPEKSYSYISPDESAIWDLFISSLTVFLSLYVMENNFIDNTLQVEETVPLL